jgi:hypothetical protein
MYISIIPSILRRRNHATTKETICKDCEKLKKKIAYWRDLAGRYKASIDALYGRLREARVARADRTKPVHHSRILRHTLRRKGRSSWRRFRPSVCLPLC